MPIRRKAPRKGPKKGKEETDTEDSAGPSTRASPSSSKMDSKEEKEQKAAAKELEKAKRDAEKSEEKERKDAEKKAKKEQKEQEKKEKKARTKKKDTKGKKKSQVYVSVPDTSENTEVDLDDLEEEDEDDEELYEFVKNQDVEGVNNYIEQNYLSGPKTSRINFFSRKENADVLTMAVKTGNLEIVDSILKVRDVILTRNGLLTAIKAENRKMVRKILQYNNNDTKKAAQIVPSLTRKRSGSSIALDLTSTSEFENYVTPVMLAATTGNYDIIEIFFDRGDRIEAPHSPSCTCDVCKLSNMTLHKAYQRLYVLEAMVNPAYLALLSADMDHKDPLDECFNAIAKIQEFKSLEPEFNEGYEALKEKIEKFTVDMLGLCHTDAEVQLLMGYKGKKDIVVHHHTGNTAVEQNYPRLVTAITTSSKKFVSHPHSQEILFQLWRVDSIMGLNYENTCHRILIITLLGGLWPLWALYSMFDPHIIQTQFGKPQARCIYSAGSHIFFLFLLATLHSDVLSLADRGETHIYLKMLIAFFVLNYIIKLVAHFVLANFRGVPFTGWDYFEAIHLVVFLATLAFWMMAALRERPSIVKRDQWDWDDPVLLGEAVMSIATTMAFLKILKLFVLNSTFGPLQTSFGKMARVAITFFLFFGIINFATTLGLYYIYRPYKNFVAYDKDGKKTEQDQTWMTLSSASYNLFWLTFAGTSPSTTHIVKVQEKCHNESMALCQDNVIAYNHHSFTQSTGNFIYCCYLFLCCTIMLNMIIAVIGKTYEKVLSNVEVEWKFSRSEVWMGFMKEKLSPPPFTIFSVVFAMVGGVISSSKQKKMDVESVKAGKPDYRMLVKHLLQRYFRKTLREASGLKPTKQHVANAKEAIKQLTGRIRNLNNPKPNFS